MENDERGELGLRPHVFFVERVARKDVFVAERMFLDWGIGRACRGSFLDG